MEIKQTLNSKLIFENVSIDERFFDYERFEYIRTNSSHASTRHKFQPETKSEGKKRKRDETAPHSFERTYF